MGWIVLGILVLLIILLIGMYNNLVRLSAQCDNAWADIDVQLKRRYDLIPNLVETVKDYAAHEQGTLDAVINARSRAMSATSPADKGQAETILSGALKSLFALAEAYPQLRAVESFTSLQSSLSQIEDAVQNARRYYNAVSSRRTCLPACSALRRGNISRSPRARSGKRQKSASARGPLDSCPATKVRLRN